MNAYIVEIRESDGNDCTVYDCIVDAHSEQDAFDRVYAHFDERAEHEDWENDGGEGWYFPCDCTDADADACEGHGGLMIGDAEEFASRADAEHAHATITYYHSLYVLYPVSKES